MDKNAAMPSPETEANTKKLFDAFFSAAFSHTLENSSNRTGVLNPEDELHAIKLTTDNYPSKKRGDSELLITYNKHSNTISIDYTMRHRVKGNEPRVVDLEKTHVISPTTSIEEATMPVRKLSSYMSNFMQDTTPDQIEKQIARGMHENVSLD